MSVNMEEAAQTVEAEKKEVVEMNTAVEVDDETEKNARAKQNPVSTEIYTGKVAVWKNAHGFILYMDGEEEKKIFVHKSSIKTDDKKVLLRRGAQLQFKVETQEKDKFKAVEVTAVGGGPLNFHEKQGESDPYDRELVHAESTFTGEVKFFSRIRGYGRIEMSAESVEKLKGLNATEEEMGATKDLYFKELDMEVESFPAKLARTDKVSFNLFNSSRGMGAMKIRTESGELIPPFTQADREAKREAKRALVEERKKEQKQIQKEKRNARRAEKRAKKAELQAKKAEEKKEKKARRNQRKNAKKEQKPEEWKEIDASARFEGKVSAFSVHRFGFIEMNSDAEFEALCEFGRIKNSKLCFRVQDIETEARPPMVDVEAKVKFSLNRMDNGVLYAVNVRDENEKPIVAEAKFEAPEPKELLNEEWCEGKVKFYNWRRGHGRVAIGEEEFYFHRNDIKSSDKVPGVEDDSEVLCQKVNDPKGPAVTNICNRDKTAFSNQLPPYLKKN